MCGIVAYIGRKDAFPILIKGLSRLEYRGYDSAGIALMETNHINLFKKQGKVADLVEYTKSENFPHCICKCVMKIFSPHNSHAASMPFVPTKSFYHWPARTDFSSALHRSRQTAASTDTPVLGHSTQRQSAGDDASSPLPHG